MRIDVITLFPDLINSYFSQGIIFQGIKKGLLEIHTTYLRDYGRGNYAQVDDRVFGGGAGMALMFEPMAEAVAAKKLEQKNLGIEKTLVIATTASGEIFNQKTAKTLEAANTGLIILCGRYEGFDQRILDELVDMEISLGKFVISGGELAAMVIIEAVARLIPGVLGKQESYEHDSFYEDENLAQFPQYTRPETLIHNGKELRVPKVLLSGNHAEISKWRASSRKKHTEPAVNE